jgi:hypothetical protein
MTMHAASFVQRDGYLSHLSLGWLEHLLLVQWSMLKYQLLILVILLLNAEEL